MSFDVKRFGVPKKDVKVTVIFLRVFGYRAAISSRPRRVSTNVFGP